MNRIRWFLPVLLALWGIFAIVGPVLAAVEQPTSLTITEVEAYENVRETGDQLYLVTYYITQNSTYDVDQLYIFRLLDSDGDDITSTTAYAYYNQGYGTGIVAFYLDADEAPAWQYGVLGVQICGNPLVDWDGATPETTMTIIIWHTDTITEQNAAVSEKIMSLAMELELLWGVDLTTTTQGVTMLNETGAAYFLRVVPYLGEVAPYVLGEYTFLPDYPEGKPELGVPYKTDFADELEEGIFGTIFDLRGPARSLGVSRGALTAGIYYVFVAIFFVLLISKRGLKKGMMLLLWPFIIGGAFIGVPLVVTIVGGFLCLGAMVWVFYKSSTA